MKPTFDELLEDLLREDAEIEPVAGIETRILRRIEGPEHTTFLLGSWLWKAAGLVLSSVVLVTVFLTNRPLRLDTSRLPVTASSAPTPVDSRVSPPFQTLRAHNSVVRPAKRNRVETTRRLASKAEAELPTQATFPSAAEPDRGIQELAKLAKNNIQLSGLSHDELQDKDPAPLVIRPIAIAAILIPPLVADKQ